jgi:hypothetical protein
MLKRCERGSAGDMEMIEWIDEQELSCPNLSMRAMVVSVLGQRIKSSPKCSIDGPLIYSSDLDTHAFSSAVAVKRV